MLLIENLACPRAYTHRIREAASFGGLADTKRMAVSRGAVRPFRCGYWTHLIDPPHGRPIAICSMKLPSPAWFPASAPPSTKDRTHSTTRSIQPPSPEQAIAASDQVSLPSCMQATKLAPAGRRADDVITPDTTSTKVSSPDVARFICGCAIVASRPFTLAPRCHLTGPSVAVSLPHSLRARPHCPCSG